MERYAAHLRYYIGDPLEAIRKEDLERLAEVYGVRLSFDRIDHRISAAGRLKEETLDRPIEEISQDVITLASDDEANFRSALAALYEKYRSPRTPYGFWGSSREGERIAKAVADETGGGW